MLPATPVSRGAATGRSDAKSKGTTTSLTGWAAPKKLKKIVVSAKGSKVLDLEHNNTAATKGEAEDRTPPQANRKMGPTVSSGGTTANGKTVKTEENTGSKVRHNNPTVQKQLDVAAGKLQQQLNPKQNKKREKKTILR